MKPLHAAILSAVALGTAVYVAMIQSEIDPPKSVEVIPPKPVEKPTPSEPTKTE